MDPKHPSTLAYLASSDVAEEYDDYFDGAPLFAYDTKLIRGWFEVPGRLLDVGCGTARHVIELARRGHQVIGLDLSEHMLGVAREKVQEAGVGAFLVRGDMLRTERLFRAGSFDYAICMFSTLGLVAGHAHRVGFLEGLARVLRPGGRLAVHVHNRWHGVTTLHGIHSTLSNLWETHRGRAEWGDKILWYYRGIRNMYVHVFSRQELEGLLRQAGLRVLEMVPLNGRRSGPLRLRIATGVRANGYIALAERA
ncbi:MAG: class I SAM-dependent methyltransferase [Phycisphaerae bacterium]|nr:class I SAM-dependent methyltransferase [Phycisphaerae bacterium]